MELRDSWEDVPSLEEAMQPMKSSKVTRKDVGLNQKSAPSQQRPWKVRLVVCTPPDELASEQ